MCSGLDGRLQKTFPHHFGRDTRDEYGRPKPKPELKFIHQSRKDIDDYWTSLIWTVADGNANEYESLKGTEIEEFYRLLDAWYAQKKREIDQYK